MRIKTAQYITKKQNGSYAVSAYRYQETIGDRSFQKGDMFCLLSLESEEDIQAMTLSKFVWDGILDAYMYSEAGTPNEAIMEALRMGEKKVRDLIKNDKGLEESGVDLNFALVVNKKEGFYVGVYGNMEVFVYREGNFVCISEVLKKNNAKTAGVVLKKDELMAISTPELFSAFVDSFDNSAGVDAIEESLKSIENSLEGLEGIFTLRVEEDSRISVGEEESSAKVENDIEEREGGNGNDVLQKGKNVGGIVLRKINGFVPTRVKNILFDVKRFFSSNFLKAKESFLEKLDPLRDKVNEFLSDRKIFKKAKSKISEMKFKKPGIGVTGFRVDEYKTRNIKQKRIRVAVVVFAVILGISFLVRYIVIKKHENEVHDLVTEQMDEVEGYLSQANDNVVKDKDSAEIYLNSAKEILDSLSEEISEEDLERKSSLVKEHLEIEDMLFNRVAVSKEDSSLTEFIDTRLIFGDKSSPTDIVLYTDTSGNDYLYISDKGTKAVHRVAVYDKSVETIPDTEGLVKSPEYIDFGEKGIYVYDSSQGVLYAPFNSAGFNDNFKTLTGVKSRDIDDDSISEMAILTTSDNIYLLSRNEKAIFKSTNTGSGYGLTYAYIKSESFSDASDFFSDFTVYVMAGSYGLQTFIYSYITGEYSYSQMTLSGLREDFVNLTKGYTTGDLSFGLYVFDSVQKRFVKFEKPQESENLHPGEEVFKVEYIYRGSDASVFSDVKDFVVDPTETYMYVLDGKTVWRVAL